jgi:hypothetical protein
MYASIDFGNIYTRMGLFRFNESEPRLSTVDEVADRNGKKESL